MTSRLHLPMATCTSRPTWTADALNALVFNGYVRPNVEEPDRRRVTWRDAVHLRSVSAACRAAVDSEEFWRLQYGLLRTGKVFSPPAIREVLEHGTASQRPYRDAFALTDRCSGLADSSREDHDSSARHGFEPHRTSANFFAYVIFLPMVLRFSFAFG